MMVVSPFLAKRTHLRSPIAAAFLRSKGVCSGPWPPIMSVPEHSPRCTLQHIVRQHAIPSFADPTTQVPTTLNADASTAVQEPVEPTKVPVHDSCKKAVAEQGARASAYVSRYTIDWDSGCGSYIQAECLCTRMTHTVILQAAPSFQPHLRQICGGRPQGWAERCHSSVSPRCASPLKGGWNFC